MNKRTRNLMAGLLALATLLFAGCIDYEEHLTFNSDGSGTIYMKYAVDRVYLDQMMEMYKGMAQTMPDMEIPESPTETMFKREEIEAGLAREDGRIKLIKYEISEDDKAYKWDMEFSFTDSDDLGLLYAALSPEDQMPEEEQPTDDVRWLTEQDDGTLLFVRDLNGDEEFTEENEGSDGYEDYYNDEYADDSEDEDDGDSPFDQSMDEGVEQLTDAVEQMAEGMANHIIVFKVTFPGTVIESNATSVDGNTATWKYKLGEFQTAPPAQRAVIKP